MKKFQLTIFKQFYELENLVSIIAANNEGIIDLSLNKIEGYLLCRNSILKQDFYMERSQFLIKISDKSGDLCHIIESIS